MREAIRVQPGERGRRRVHRLRLHRRRLPQQRGDDLRHAEALGRAQGDRAAARRRAASCKTGRHQGGARARVQPAADLRPRHRRRLRVLHPEPRRRRPEAARRGDAGSSSARAQAATRARRRADAVARRRCRSSTSTSTARRRRRSACRSTTSSTRCGARSARYYVNDFNKYGRTWQVLMSAEPRYRKRPDDIGDVYVRSTKGEMMPLSRARHASATSSGPDTLERFNNLPAVKILGSGAPGVSSGQAIARSRADRRARCCRPTSASTGAARRTRRSARRGTSASRSRSRSSWCS